MVVKPGAGVTAEEIRSHVRGLLAGYKVPDEVLLVEQLPRTATGKVRKNELRVRPVAPAG